jgi:lantibiotic modifying enzyme
MYHYIEHILVSRFAYKPNKEVLRDSSVAVRFRDKIIREVELLVSPLTLRYGMRLEQAACESKNDELFNLIFEQYPYLKILIAKKVEDHLNFEQHVYSHFEIFRSRVLHKDCRIVDVSMTLADPHNSGKINLILNLSDGSQWVYKARTSRNELFFNDFINYIYSKAGIETKAFAIHNFDGFSFCEYIQHKPCLSEHEVQEFYRRIGQQLFALWYFDASDINHENIIACGKFPCIIDLEIISPPKTEIKHRYPPAHSFAASVLSTLLLPEWTVVREGVFTNMSGLSETTESINYLYERYSSRHMPYMNNMKCSCKHFLADIQRGFAEAFRIFQKEDLVIREMAGLANFTNRIIIHPTSFYRKVIEVLNLPENLTSAGRQKEIIRAFYADRQDQLYTNEEQCLLERDIPIYYARHKSADLYYKDQTIPGYFMSTGQQQMALCRQKTTAENVAFQQRLIETSIRSLDPVFFKRKDRRLDLSLHQNRGLEALVDAIADNLIRVNGSLFWLAKKQLGQGFYGARHTGIDLLSGHTGIAFSLLLAYHTLERPPASFISELLKQDLQYIRMLLELPDMAGDDYLISHAAFIEALLEFSEQEVKDVDSLVALFFDTLNCLGNKAFVSIVNGHAGKAPVPDLTAKPLDVLIPYAISAIRYQKEEQACLLELLLEDRPCDGEEDMVMENGLSGILFSLIFDKLTVSKKRSMVT